jgi:hypothetical protein
MNDLIKLLDAQMTDSEFRTTTANLRLLKKCKENGFPKLKAYGLIRYPDEKPKKSE